jgi:hypothetical protein
MPVTEPDNVMPNTGGVYQTEPPEQKEERQKEKAQTIQAMPILKEVIKRLDKRIEFYNSVDSIPDEDKKDPTRFVNMHNANELTRNNLQLEKEYIEDLIDTHAKPK